MIQVSAERLFFCIAFWMGLAFSYGFWRGRKYERNYPKA